MFAKWQAIALARGLQRFDNVVLVGLFIVLVGLFILLVGLFTVSLAHGLLRLNNHLFCFEKK